MADREHPSFEQDLYLKPLAARLGEFDVVSFDVFDTLLLRTCHEPADIFRRVGRRLAQEHGFAYGPDAWAALRGEAARRARGQRQAQGGSGEYFYADIFAQMPFPREMREAMRALEWEEEGRALYLNPSMAGFLAHCRAAGKQIALLSDMYFTAEEVLALLAGAGLDTALVDHCLISCEADQRKTGGGLFETLKARLPGVPPARMLHIGDNETADVQGARMAGLQAAHYGVVPQAFGSLYDVERRRYGAQLGELASLRKLAAAGNAGEENEEEAFFYALGAQIIGPVCALFADWAVAWAQRKGVEVLLPLTREGALLTQLLGRAIGHRGAALDCRLFYSSRHPLFVASIGEGNIEAKLGQLLNKPQLRVADLFGQAGVPMGDFAPLADRTLEETRARGDYEEIVALFGRGATRQAVLAHAARQRALLLRYLDEATGGRPAATVDIGMKGTSQTLLREILAEEGQGRSLAHLLVMGSPATNVKHIMGGLDIDAFLGIAGDNGARLARMLYLVTMVEMQLGATHGTVLGYREEDGRVAPVLDEEEGAVLAGEGPRVAACWRGAAAFQRLWLALSGQKPGLAEGLLERRHQLLDIWLRFVEMPESQEAQYVGAMVHHDRFSWKNPMPLCDFALPQGAAEEEVAQYLAAARRGRTIWPQAAVAAARPDYYPRQFLRGLSNAPAMGRMIDIVEEIKAQAPGANVVIYAAAQRGQDFLRVCRMLGQPVHCFADGNKALQGGQVGGLPVVAPESLGDEADIFVVASFLYPDEITANIHRLYAGREKQPRIYVI